MWLLAFVLLADTSETFRIEVAPAESLQVTVAGEGRPVVMVPGLFGSAYAFRHVVELLIDAGCQAVIIEPLAMGSSSRPESADYSLTAQADRVAAAMEFLRLEPAVLVGHSVGASVALRLAYRHPGRVTAIVSIEGGPGEAAATPGFKRWIRFAPAARMLNGRRLVMSMINKDIRAASADDSWVDQEAVLGYLGGLATDFRGTLKAYKTMARAEEPESLKEHLPLIDLPVLLLMGGAEHKSGPLAEELVVLQMGLPRFTVDTIPASGFFIHEEQPKAVADAVMGLFLEENESGTN